MTTVRKALYLVLSERYLLLAMQMGRFVIIARLLTPDEIGIFAVATAFVALAQTIRDLGIGSYLIQETELTLARSRTAFTLTLSLATLLFIATLLASGVVADFYDDGRLKPVLTALAVNFLLIPFGSVGLSILTREMKFPVLFRINLTSAAVGFTVAVTLAILGAGYWALVVSSIASTLVTSVLAATRSLEHHSYGIEFSEWRRVLSFGGPMSGAAIAFETATSVSDLVVARSLGFSGLAMLSRAQGVVQLFQRDVMAAVRTVAFPAFARNERDGTGTDNDFNHSRAVVILTGIAWPVYAYLSLFPLEVLRLLFGPQWDHAAAVVPILCAGGALAALGNLIPQLLMATGHIQLVLRAEVLNQAMRILIVLLCAIWFANLNGFATGILLYYALSQLTYIQVKRTAYGTYLPGAGKGLSSSLAVVLFSVTLPALYKYFWLDSGTAPELAAAVSGALFALSWILGIVVLNHPLYQDKLFSVPRRYIARLRGRKSVE